ncbi:MAG TPA: hypothetical protein DEQ43_06525, partial [Nocardioides bacterium]|uniref:hypothetical protein n=1 Tax=uncultured Nocardioides sp. TaxID=198441 RepID=UPI000EEF63AF
MSTHPTLLSLRGRPAFAAGLVVLLVVLLIGTVVAGVVALRPDRAAGAEPQVVVLAEQFSTSAAGDRFRTSGPGSWRVGHGSYVLHSGRTGLRGAARSPLSVLATPLSAASTWQLETTVRTKRATGTEFSVVFAHRDRSDYTYLHLDRDRSRSGIYRVRRGHTTRLAKVDAAVTPGRAQQVELRRTPGKIRVYVGSGSDAEYVGGTTLGGSAPPRPGFGSWGASVWIDDLVVTVPRSATGTPGSGSTGGTPGGPPSVPPTVPPTATPPPGGRSVSVSTSDQLTAALADARPGDVITLADGIYTTKGLAASTSIGGKTYYGTFVLERSGTAQAPIVVQGSRAAVIDGKPGDTGTGTQYGL